MADAETKGSPYYCWFDTEYTSLELDDARLLQVALMVTDHELRPVLPPGEVAVPSALRNPVGFAACLRWPDGYQPNEWAREHLAGVLEGARASTLDEAGADALLCAWVDAICGPPAKSALGRPNLAGSSVHNDWFLLRRDLPGFHARLSYRLLDVSSFKLEVRNHLRAADPPKLDKEDTAAVRRWFPHLAGEQGPHDAMYDAQASAAELAMYRAALKG